MYTRIGLRKVKPGSGDDFEAVYRELTLEGPKIDVLLLSTGLFELGSFQLTSQGIAGDRVVVTL